MGLTNLWSSAESFLFVGVYGVWASCVAFEVLHTRLPPLVVKKESNYPNPNTKISTYYSRMIVIGSLL